MERVNRQARTQRSLAGFLRLGLLLLLLATTDLAVGAPPRDALSRKLGAILDKLPHASAVAGACALDLNSNEIVYRVNAGEALIPASAMKLFALAAGIRELGADFSFTTRLAFDGTDIAIIGDGDPSMGDEKLCTMRGENRLAFAIAWAEALSHAGVTHITGDILVDISLFDDSTVHPSWEPQDLNKWYGAPVSALNINGNCLDITVSPGGAVGASVRVEVHPPNAAAVIVNKCRTGKGKDPILHLRPNTLEYVISGRCNKKWPFVAVPFPDPPRLCAEAFRDVLADHGISVAGEVRRKRIRRPDGSLPTGWNVVATHQTPLIEILPRIGKNSQNMFAECLLKRSGYAWAVREGHADPVGSWSTGREAVLDLVSQTGMDRTGLVVDDGSGLCRTNRTTAEHLTRLLGWVHGQPYADLFVASLSVAGVDGSLRKRLKSIPGRVIGKTGTMRGVRALAGYIRDGAGRRRYAFAIIFNGYKGPSTPYRVLQDEFCRALVDATDNLGAGATH